MNGTPAVGDIVQWPTAAGGIGHVAYVYAVNNGVASISEYNHAGNGRYYTQTARSLQILLASTSSTWVLPPGGASWHGVGSYANRGESLASGATLYLNQYDFPNVQHALVFQADESALYNQQFIWEAPGSAGNGDRLAMQPDGNLVMPY